MTVKEFIEELKKCDQNKEIFVVKTYQDEFDEINFYTENETPYIEMHKNEKQESFYVIN